jgi:hypothetical protein
MRLFGALAIAAVFSLSMCIMDRGNASIDAARATLADLTERLERDEISRVEIVFVPPRILTRVAITPETIEGIYHYKFTIRELRNGLYHQDLARAVKTVSLESREDLPDMRWGIIFYDTTDQRVAGIYLNGTGGEGAIDLDPVIVRGELYDWLQAQFSATFR